MSKMVTGEIKIGSLNDVEAAAGKLGWIFETNGEGQWARVNVPREEGAYYHPYIDVTQEQGKWSMTYDHMMGLTTIGADDHDDVTRQVVGKFKQALAMVQVEELLNQENASWSVVTREDGAQVLTVSR